MSACLILQTPTQIFIGADTAVSTKVNNQLFRLDNSGIKLYQRGNKVIFCSGVMDMAYQVMLEYQRTKDGTFQDLQKIMKKVCGNDTTVKLTVVITEVNSKGSVIYEISPENNFEIITQRMSKDQEGIAIWAAGIKTTELVEAAQKLITQGFSVTSIFRKAYETISYECVGGFLIVKQVTQFGIMEVLNEAISEPVGIKVLTEELYYRLIVQHLIIAERLMGKIIAGVNLVIDASDSSGNKTFTVDSRGVTIAGTALTITGGLPPSQLDPSFKDSLVNLNKSYNGVVIDAVNGLVITKTDNTVRTILNATEGFSFEKRQSGGSWTKMLFYEAATGNLKVNGEIDASALKVRGVNVLTVDGKISANGIEPLEVGRNVVMGPNAYISWSNVGDKPWIPTNATEIGAIPSTYIDSQGIWTGKINANSIVAGTINADLIKGGTISGTTISIDTNLRVGDNIYLGNQSSSSNKRVYFNNGSYIWGYGSPGWSIGIKSDNLWIDTKTVEYAAGTKINFANAAVSGLNVTAKFA
ncbi:hypothetical protein BBD41_27180 [Paenibacillus ihbetae]|uniref:Prophage tail endopeptidase domain-containing protein n=1 Tax=Paenibacillus ihbetae TaxID=1870820 RepID=A0A1B2E7M6_9BACL|nr:hypothetical protein [Paenibacillus ihbetae]ANY75961.1 hypothetical protein BBD41_27180 [Paenibacillus ihbetae]